MALKNKSSLYDLHSIFYILYDPTVNSVSNFRYHQTSTVALCLPRSLCSASQVHPRITHQLLRSAESKTNPPVSFNTHALCRLAGRAARRTGRSCSPRVGPSRSSQPPMDDPGAADPAARHHLSPQPVTRPQPPVPRALPGHARPGLRRSRRVPPPLTLASPAGAPAGSAHPVALRRPDPRAEVAASHALPLPATALLLARLAPRQSGVRPASGWRRSAAGCGRRS